MKKRTKGKVIVLILLVLFDLGFASKFSQYDMANKIFALAVFAITPVTIFLIIKDIITMNKEAIKDKESIQESINSIRAGNIPRLETCSLILKPEEYACVEIQTYLTETKNKVVGSTGSSGGVSVRVARGVYIRSGSNRSRKIYKNVTVKFGGTLVITNQRIVFLNNQKGFEVLYKNLTGVLSSGNNLVVQSRNKSYTIPTRFSSIYEELIRTFT